MNKTYSTRWNAALGTWVAVSEITRRHGRGTRGAAGIALSLTLALATSHVAAETIDIKPGQTLPNLDTINYDGGTIARNGMLINNGALTNTGDLTNDGDILNSQMIRNDGNLFNNGALTNENTAYNYGSLINNGTLTNKHTVYNYGTLINSRTLINNGSLINLGTLNTSYWLVGDVENHGNLEFSNISLLLHNGTISGSGRVSKTQSGSLTLGGNNTYEGGTTLENGTLSIRNSNALGTGALTVTGDATFTASDDIAFANAIKLDKQLTVPIDSSLTLDGVISGDGSLVKNGVGNLTLTGNNTYTGGTTLNTGKITLGHANALGTGTLTVGGNATLSNDAVINLANDIALVADAALTVGDQQNLSLSGEISGTGGLVKAGTSVLTINGQNSYTGETVVNGGTLALNANGSIASSKSVELKGNSTLDITAGSQTIQSLNGIATTTVALGGQTLTVKSDLYDSHFSGNIMGSGRLTKDGDGTLTLDGPSNIYSGGTSLQKGTLLLGSNNAIGTGLLLVAGDSKLGASNNSTTGHFNELAIANNIMTGAALTLESPAKIELNGIISGSGSLVKTGPGELHLNQHNTYTGGTTIDNATVFLGQQGALGGGALTVKGSTASTISSDQHMLALFNDITLQDTSTLDFNIDNTLGVFGTITGTGGLTKSGAGTLTLSEQSEHTGATTITEGTLELLETNAIAGSKIVRVIGGTLKAESSQSIQTLEGEAAGSIVLDGDLKIGGNGGRNTDSYFEGTISGNGKVVKFGNGTLSLSGINHYQQGTDLYGGTLEVGSAIALGRSRLTVYKNATLRTSANIDLSNGVELEDGATLSVTGSNDLGFVDSISGAGSLEKSGTGILTLAGSNSYYGNTIFKEGTIIIQDNNALGFSKLRVSGDGTLVSFTNLAIGNEIDIDTHTLTVATESSPSSQEKLTFDGVISGAGNLNKTGIGNLLLTQVNSFSGNTTISDGTLTLGLGSSLAKSNITLKRGATFDLSMAGDQTIKQLAGEDFSTLLLGAHTLTLGDDTDTALASTIDGTGGLIKHGKGTLTLSGTSYANYSGNVTVNAGTLDMLSQHLGQNRAFVNNGGTLSGSGTIGTTTIAAGGTLYAKNGTFNIGGDYTQAATGKLMIDAQSTTSHGRVAVSGTASFQPDANLFVNVLSANTLGNGQTLTNVISAGTLDATTFKVNSNSALFDFTAHQTGNQVDLTIGANSSTGVADAVREHNFTTAAGAAQVLDQLITSGAGGDMGAVITALGKLPDTQDVARAAAQTLPLVSSHDATQSMLSGFQNLVQQRLSDPAGSSTPSGLASGDSVADKQVWGRAFGGQSRQSNDNGAPGFNADSWGTAIGTDTRIGNSSRIGAAYGYAKTTLKGHAEFAGTNQKNDIQSHVVSLYGSSALAGNRTFSWQADAGLHENRTARTIAFGGLQRTANGDYRTYSAHIGAAVGQRIDLGESTSLTPTLRADYTWMKSQSYNERGADSLNLGVADNKSKSLVVGFDTHMEYRVSDRSRINAVLGAGYDTLGERNIVQAAYAGAPEQSFMTPGIERSRWLARAGLGYTMQNLSGSSVTLRYDAQGQRGFINHAASVRANFAF